MDAVSKGTTGYACRECACVCVYVCVQSSCQSACCVQPIAVIMGMRDVGLNQGCYESVLLSMYSGATATGSVALCRV